MLLYPLCSQTLRDFNTMSKTTPFSSQCILLWCTLCIASGGSVVVISKLYLDLSRLLAVHVERTIELYVNNEHHPPPTIPIVLSLLLSRLYNILTNLLFFFFLHLVRELLSFYEFPGDDIPVIKGSALAAATGGDTKLGRDSILELMNAVESYIPTPARETEKPFLMPVEDTFSISGRGTVVTGRVEQGKIKTGEDIEVVGLVATQKTICTGKPMMLLCMCVWMNETAV